MSGPQLLDTAALRRRIDLADRRLFDRFWNGEDAELLVAERARFFDAFLVEIWQHAFQYRDDLALLAVGGYGRGELHPRSDIDLLILVRNSQRSAEDIAAFVRLLWDLKLDIGHSVRTVRECRREAAGDITVATALIERRRLSGSDILCARLDRALDSARPWWSPMSGGVWPSRRFFEAKRAEQADRHAQFDDVEYDLEPNIKGSPGGLRDIQTVGWITRRHLGTSDLSELTRQGYLTPQERGWLIEGRKFLCRVRFGLHLVATRREDRLLFDHQRTLAERFGYRDSDAQLAVEQFMHDYYRHVLELREVNDILLQHFDEAILRGRRAPRIEPINARFQVNNRYMETTSPAVFRNHPAALLELFVIMANRRDIVGVRAATIRLIRDHLELIDDEFRSDPDVNRYFIELLRAPYTVVSQLTRMRRYGILGRYIPEFGRIVGQMQHDLFHIYTVDAHTMMVIRNMRRFRYPSSAETFPLAMRCVRSIPKIELLYIAGLFHDIGKGRGGNHSELGAGDAVAFCRRHGLSDEETELVEWLVRSHLVMSTTAQHKDIHDPAIVHEFAGGVRTTTRLDYLYALTVADITATNPTLWNGWRATLMHQLYMETHDALTRGLEGGPERAKRIASCREAALQELADKGIARERGLALWDNAGDDLFLRHTPTQLAAITAAMHEHDLDRGPLVYLQDVASEVGGEGATEIFLYTGDRPNLFAASVIALDELHLQVHDARIVTTESGLCLNSYIVLDGHNRPIPDEGDRRRRVRTTLARRLSAQDLTHSVRRRVDRRLKEFVIPTETDLTLDPSSRHSRLRVVCSDRPGLLALLGMLFVELGIGVRRARITTLGERVEDVFVIDPIRDPVEVERIENTIRTRLDEEVAQSTAGAGRAA
ncbi:MAG: [protein-PII] uridylyltransferase [Gammaproteobacteria bacterium]|nr:[protein-PII] uridylyltransferase [Gammaproteobacteria bacterium]